MIEASVAWKYNGPVSGWGVIMVSTLRSRPNHYEVLGLTPRATSDEVARAFAREIGPSRPHAFGDVAQVSTAYAVLRDPTRRRAYDESLGLLPKPRPQPQVSMTGRLAPFIAAAPTAARAAVPQPRPTPLPEARTASFIAASLREPQSAEPQAEVKVEVQAEVQAEPQPVAPRRTAPPNASHRPLRRAPGTRLADVESEPVEWKRAAILGGAVVVGVGLLGAVAGMQAGNDAEAQQHDRAVTLALPQARSPAAVTTASPALAPNVKQARPERPRRPLLARAERAQAASPPLARQEQESAAAVRSPPEMNPAEEAAVEAPAAAVVAAKMPLANATIARTIARIGYPCGAVSSTADGGAPGVFTVTCTSGHSYQASPVRGRYRFRRLSSH
jgi:hypothetical protein